VATNKVGSDVSKKNSTNALTMQRVQQLSDQILEDLGGEQNSSQAQRQLARRGAALAVICEQLEPAAVAGLVDAIEPYLRTSETLRRILLSLGIEPLHQSNVADLSEYLRSNYTDSEEQ